MVPTVVFDSHDYWSHCPYPSERQLWWCCLRGSSETLRAIFEEWSQPPSHFIDAENRSSALHVMVRSFSQLDQDIQSILVGRLVEMGVDPNAQDKDHLTALDYVAGGWKKRAEERLALAGQLVSYGARNSFYGDSSPLIRFFEQCYSQSDFERIVETFLNNGDTLQSVLFSGELNHRFIAPWAALLEERIAQAQHTQITNHLGNAAPRGARKI